MEVASSASPGHVPLVAVATLVVVVVAAWVVMHVSSEGRVSGFSASTTPILPAQADLPRSANRVEQPPTARSGLVHAAAVGTLAFTPAPTEKDEEPDVLFAPMSDEEPQRPTHACHSSPGTALRAAPASVRGQTEAAGPSARQAVRPDQLRGISWLGCTTRCRGEPAALGRLHRCARCTRDLLPVQLGVGVGGDGQDDNTSEASHDAIVTGDERTI
jgi:hypothetical protein